MDLLLLVLLIRTSIIGSLLHRGLEIGITTLYHCIHQMALCLRNNTMQIVLQLVGLIWIYPACQHKMAGTLLLKNLWILHLSWDRWQYPKVILMDYKQDNITRL